MAFGEQQISPIDFNKSAAVGVDIPFSSGDVFTPNFTTAAAIKNNLINFFLTNPGERPLNPTFGAGLRSFIFEHIANENLDFLERRQALAINPSGVTMLKGDPSYSSNDQILIDELVFYIKQNNLKAD